MGQPTITPAIAASSTAAPNLQTTSSGTVHASRDGQPLCASRARAGFAETRLAVSCKHCLKLTAAAVVEPVQSQELSLRVSPLTLSDAPACAPWCVEHDPDGDICSAPNLDAGDGYGGVVGLTSQPDEGLRIHLDLTEGLSLEDGKTLAAAILAQVEVAERERVVPVFAADKVSVANGAPIQVTRPCKPWCVDHDHDALDEFDGYCVAECLAIPGKPHPWEPSMPGYVSLSYHPANFNGPLITLNHNSDAELTLDEAEQVALALLKQVAAGREESLPLPTDIDLRFAFRTGMLSGLRYALQVGLDTMLDLALEWNALSDAEIDEMVAAMRWIHLKRQMADVYPATGPAVAA